ncbi:MAG: transglutaminase-like domain-containing protein [Gammaproteobacteria bacterium]
MKTSLISLLRQNALFMNSTALITALTFSMLVTSPAAMALRKADVNLVEAGETHPEARLSSLLEQITRKFDLLEAAHGAGQATDNIVSELDGLQDQMIDLDNEVMANFEAMEQTLKDKKLPMTILQRHHDMVAHYQAHRARIIEQFEDSDMSHWRWLLGRWWGRLLVWLGVDIEEIVESPFQVVNPRQFKRSHQAFDPNNLPNKSMRPDKDNKPKRSKQDYRQASLFNSPVNKVANLGDFSYDALAGASDPAYLAETDEVVLTLRIKEQAQLLNYDPVKIYHWVRNNVEWQPTWGAVQDAELTLDARRGNAMDIASLTIALLRASQIPARYVHGTIEVPEAPYRNWAGGFTSIDAAADFAASGGIPSAVAILGGKISHVQLEHVWVEAAIDYFPSRGAINQDADAWVQMDPSYKLYEYLQGLDAVQISGIDKNQLANDFLASGTLNETEGWIQGFDPAILETAHAQAQTALEDYITTNMTDPTNGDIIGGRKTIIQEYPVLPSSLPNRILVEGARYDKLPSQLQQQVTYTLGYDEFRQPYNPTTFAWSTLNNQKVTLSFRPAKLDDEIALQSLIPEGEITDISQLPQSIPSYLIEVVPELIVNGELKITGLPMKLGEELVFNTKIRFSGRSKQENYTYKVIAGSYLSVNVVAGNVSSQKIKLVQSNLITTQSKLDSKDYARISSLTQQELMGDIFYTGTLAYFAQLHALNKVTALNSNAHVVFTSGYGTIGYEPKVTYFFGHPAAIQPGGIVLDIPISSVTAANDGNIEKKRSVVMRSGISSSLLEHIVPEQFYNDKSSHIDAFSAVKALQIATVQGQRIYHITKENVGSITPDLNLSAGVESEIFASVTMGLEVITHIDPVSVPGYTGEGYIIFDPQTGSGAYKIGGGQNGAFSYAFNAFTTHLNLLATGVNIYGAATNIAKSLAGGFAARFIGASVLLGFVNSVHQILAHCPNDNLENVGNLVALMAVTLLTLFFTALAGIWFGPLGVSVVSAVFSQGANLAMQYALNSTKGCRIQ